MDLTRHIIGKKSANIDQNEMTELPWKGVLGIVNSQSILRRVQAAGAGAEGDVHALGIFRVRPRAVPQARAAVDALLAVKGRHAGFAGINGLAAARLDANPRAAFLAEFG